jgi:hypothetical protein
MVRDGAEPVIGPRFALSRWRLLTMRESRLYFPENTALRFSINACTASR